MKVSIPCNGAMKTGYFKTMRKSFEATKAKLEEARAKQFPNSTKPKE